MPMPPGVFVRREKEREQEGRRGQEGEAPAVAGEADVRVRGTEAAALRQAAGDPADERQGEEGHEVQQAPRLLTEVGDGEEQHALAGAEGGGHAEHADGVGP